MGGGRNEEEDPIVGMRTENAIQMISTMTLSSSPVLSGPGSAKMRQTRQQAFWDSQRYEQGSFERNGKQIKLRVCNEVNGAMRGL